MADKPWTWEDFESDKAPSWTIIDPNLARMVAVFFDADEAEDYLAWRNLRQAEMRERKDRPDA